MDMKTTLTAIALAAALAQPAEAVTFPSLTTIYVGTGVYELSDAVTAVHCSNVSGQTTQVRVLFLHTSGIVAGTTTLTVAHGASVTVSTSPVNGYNALSLDTANIVVGVVNIESTQSAVFCAAHVVSQSATAPTSGNPLSLVRVNPHPGTVE
jgi:hypothetical protein